MDVKIFVWARRRPIDEVGGYIGRRQSLLRVLVRGTVSLLFLIKVYKA